MGQHPTTRPCRLGPGTYRFPPPCRRAPAPCADRGPRRLRRRHAGPRRPRRRAARRAPRLTLVGLDRDPRRSRSPGRRLAAFADRVHLVHAVYDRIADVLDELGIAGVRRRPARPRRLVAAARRRPTAASPTPATPTWTCGWTRRTGPTAADVLNTYPVPALARVLREYGEERFACRIASAVGRGAGPGAVATQRRARRAALRRGAGGVPAHRRAPGQAHLPGVAHRGERRAGRRCARALPAALDALAVGGRIVVLAYHSLEDRIVKRELAARATSTTPAELPVELPGHGPELRLLDRGAEQAGEDEIAENPRAASVRLRAAERIGIRTTSDDRGSDECAGDRASAYGYADPGRSLPSGPGPAGPSAARRRGRRRSPATPPSAPTSAATTGWAGWAGCGPAAGSPQHAGPHAVRAAGDGAARDRAGRDPVAVDGGGRRLVPPDRCPHRGAHPAGAERDAAARGRDAAVGARDRAACRAAGPGPGARSRAPGRRTRRCGDGGRRAARGDPSGAARAAGPARRRTRGPGGCADPAQTPEQTPQTGCGAGRPGAAGAPVGRLRPMPRQRPARPALPPGTNAGPPTSRARPPGTQHGTAAFPGRRCGPRLMPTAPPVGDLRAQRRRRRCGARPTRSARSARAGSRRGCGSGGSCW